jgi:hypothetical protein
MIGLPPCDASIDPTRSAGSARVGWRAICCERPKPPPPPTRRSTSSMATSSGEAGRGSGSLPGSVSRLRPSTAASSRSKSRWRGKRISGANRRARWPGRTRPLSPLLALAYRRRSGAANRSGHGHVQEPASRLHRLRSDRHGPAASIQFGKLRFCRSTPSITALIGALQCNLFAVAESTGVKV